MMTSNWFASGEETAAFALKKIKEQLQGKEAAIYGGGILGVGMIKMLRYLGFNAQFVVDINPEGCKMRFNIPVISPDELKAMDNAADYVIVLAVNEQIAPEVSRQFEQLPQINLLYIPESIQNVLKKEICLQRLKDSTFNPLECFECGVVDNACEAFYEYGKSMLPPENAESYCTVEGLGIIMGSFCTLKCKHCNESLPYFENRIRGYQPKETILKDLKRITDACGVIGHVELVGGEPFLHPELGEVLKGILELNIGAIQIFTNGTIVPGRELCEILKSKRIVVYISNYEKALNQEQKKNLTKLKNIFDEFGVIYQHGRSKSWMDFSTFDLMSENEDRLKYRFEHCGMNKCHRLYDGHLFGCPHHYGGTMLGRIDTEQSLDLSKYDAVGLRAALQEFRNTPYDACRKCKMPFDAPFVEDAIQL